MTSSWWRVINDTHQWLLFAVATALSVLLHCDIRFFKKINQLAHVWELSIVREISQKCNVTKLKKKQEKKVGAIHSQYGTCSETNEVSHSLWPGLYCNEVYRTEIFPQDAKLQFTQTKYQNVNTYLYFFSLYNVGLSMNLKENKNGVQYFIFEHSKEYQKVQFQFYEAVESLNPQNIAVCIFVFLTKQNL